MMKVVCRQPYRNQREFISVALGDGAKQLGVTLEFIKPGRPMQNRRNLYLSVDLNWEGLHKESTVYFGKFIDTKKVK